MIPFSSLLLRNYYNAIGWNEDNSYSQLTRSSTDFELPKSLVLQLANSPTPVFFTSYSLDALPQLNGSLSYVTTSQALSEIQPVNNIAFKHVVDRFRVLPPPHRPYPKDEIWLRGRRVEGRDYLLYSRMHFPSLYLSGLATTRLAPTLQLHLAFLSLPNPPSARPTSPSNASHSRAPSGGDNNAASQVSSPPTPSNLLISLQHDTGKYAGEYTYSVQDGMFGWRGLYNFGWKDTLKELQEVARPSLGTGASAAVLQQAGAAGTAIVQEVQGAGQKGRFSAGAEVYFSAKQRSFGISTGMRYQTVPPIPNSSSSSLHTALHQAPTALTILYNPLIGFVSTAYSAQVHPHIALSTRFGVNVYSYESDLTVGGEWWIGRRRGKRETAARSASSPPISPVQTDKARIEEKVEKAEVRVGEEPAFGSVRAEAVEGEVDGPFAKDRIYPRSPISAETSMLQERSGNTAPSAAAGDERKDDDEREGVLKARVSGNWVSLPSDPAAGLLVAGLHLVEKKAGRPSGVSADMASQYPYYTKRVYGTAWSR